MLFSWLCYAIMHILSKLCSRLYCFIFGHFYPIIS